MFISLIKLAFMWLSEWEVTLWQEALCLQILTHKCKNEKSNEFDITYIIIFNVTK